MNAVLVQAPAQRLRPRRTPHPDAQRAANRVGFGMADLRPSAPHHSSVPYFYRVAVEQSPLFFSLSLSLSSRP